MAGLMQMPNGQMIVRPQRLPAPALPVCRRARLLCGVIKSWA